MQMPDWLLDHVAKNPHSVHGDYVIVHHDGDEGPEYPVVSAYHGSSGTQVGQVQYMPKQDLLAPGENGAPEYPERTEHPDGTVSYAEPEGLKWHPGGFWKKHLGYKVWNVEVHKDHRRKGIATAMYDHARKHLGHTFPGDFQTPDGTALNASLKKAETLAKMALIHDDPQNPATLYRVQDLWGEGPYQARVDARPGEPDNGMRSTRLLSEFSGMGRIHVPMRFGPGQDFTEQDRDELHKLGNKRFAFEKPEHATEWFGQEALDKMKEYGFSVQPVKASKVWRSKSGSQVFYEPHQPPSLAKADGYQYKFKLDKPEHLHDRNQPLEGTLEVHHKGAPVGVMSFDQIGTGQRDSIHVGYVGVHPEHRNQGLGTTMLQRFQKWVNHHRPHIHFVQGEATSKGILRHLGRTYGEPLYVADAIDQYTPSAAERELPETAPEDQNQVIDTGQYLHTIHWVGPGQRPTVHPWADLVPTKKSLKDEVRDRVLMKMGKLSKNLSRLPMPFARPQKYMHWPIGALDWRKQKIKVEHRDGAGGQPTGAGWVQVEDGQVLSQDGHPVSARNPGAR